MFESCGAFLVHSDHAGDFATADGDTLRLRSGENTLYLLVNIIAPARYAVSELWWGGEVATDARVAIQV